MSTRQETSSTATLLWIGPPMSESVYWNDVEVRYNNND